MGGLRAHGSPQVLAAGRSLPWGLSPARWCAVQMGCAGAACSCGRAVWCCDMVEEGVAWHFPPPCPQRYSRGSGLMGAAGHVPQCGAEHSAAVSSPASRVPACAKQTDTVKQGVSWKPGMMQNRFFPFLKVLPLTALDSLPTMGLPVQPCFFSPAAQ